MIYTIEVECGETTCASEPGKFCRFVGSKHFGTQPICMLYNEPINDDLAGWLGRGEKCMAELKGRNE